MERGVAVNLGILSLMTITNAQFSLRKIETLTSFISGSGMDKPSISLFGYSNGGTYSIDICSGENCCRTGVLNSEDNNWEEGHTDWFVGRQINECNRFLIDNNTDVQLTLYHKGSNAGRLTYIKLHSWHTASNYLCEINKRLDYDSSVTKSCVLQTQGDQDESEWCNGSSQFCDLKFDQFLFPGTHNAGTGQREGYLRCASKNQDLNITEQLDFGIRFFDLDTIMSDSLSGCDGLETGHGAAPELGLYQCYGKVSDLLDEVKAWMDEHTSEVIILYFGGLAFKDETVPALVQVLKEKFENTTGVSMNTDYKEKGDWPTLRAAVEDDARVFVFIRDSRVAAEQGIVESIKVKPGLEKDKKTGAVTMMTSYKAGSIGSDCSFVLSTTEESCVRTDVDLIKLSLFSSYFKSGVDCLWHMAILCNKLVDTSTNLCSSIFEKALNSTEETSIRFAPNFVLLDYPNYQTTQKLSFIQLIQNENQLRAQRIANSTAELPSTN